MNKRIYWEDYAVYRLYKKNINRFPDEYGTLNMKIEIEIDLCAVAYWDNRRKMPCKLAQFLSQYIGHTPKFWIIYNQLNCKEYKNVR